MNKRKLFVVFALILILLSFGFSSMAKIWYCIDECCMEYPNNVCEYHYENGDYACSFDGIPVNQLPRPD